MLVYEGIKKDFLNDVINDNIANKIYEKFKEKLCEPNKSEIRSWKNSMEYMYKVLSDKHIPNNSGVAIEFNIPTTSKRIDFIISGYDEYKKESIIIIELKQWQDCELVNDKDGIVKTFLGGGHRETTHPSYQAWSYANLIMDFNSAVQQSEMLIYPCAYLHNYEIKENDPMVHEIYQEYIKEAPLFGLGDVIKLRDFIKRYITEGDDKELLYKIENGKIKPSKRLQDSLVNMLEGNIEFIMIDEQKVIYEDIIRMAIDTLGRKEKNVYVVQGGPGTGKSVLAINLLVELTKRKMVCNYVTKNNTPREVFYHQLKGKYKQNYIKNLFKGSGNYIDAEENIFDVLIVDEAHRLNAKSGIFSNLGENQVKELINSSKLTIFLLDENQKVTIKDIGDLDVIKKYSKELNAGLKINELESQFRCNGSDGYLAWLDNILEIKKTANKQLDDDYNYDFQVFDDPNLLRKELEEKNINNKSRIVAGYCWDWITSGKNDPNVYDIILPRHDFKMSWNLGNTSIWAIDKNSINEAGCIHTCQGLEFDYVGVIIGNDLRYENGKIITDYTKRAKTDHSLRGIKKMMKEDEIEATKIADQIIKNTYRVLMTRGIKGCYIYCEDKGLERYFKDNLGKL